MLVGGIFVKPFSMLTGLKFSILSRYFIMKIGLTDAVFAFSDNESFRRSLLVTFVRCELIIFTDSLTICGGILSGAVAFFAFNSFIILFICPEVAAGMSNVFLTVFLLLIFRILGCVWYFQIIDCTVALALVLFSGLPSISGGEPDVFSTMLI